MTRAWRGLGEGLAGSWRGLAGCLIDADTDTDIDTDTDNDNDDDDDDDDVNIFEHCLVDTSLPEMVTR